MTTSRSRWMTLAAIGRVYSIPYVALCGITARMVNPLPPLSLTQAIAGLFLPATLTLGLAALNDYAHRNADATAQRGRDYSPNELRALGIGMSGAALLLGGLGGWPALFGIAGTILGGLLYATLKHRPGLGNILRGATSIPLVLGLAGPAALRRETLILAGAVALLDAAGNVWGDLRDLIPDCRAGFRTLAVQNPRIAARLAIALHAAAVALLCLLVPAWIVVTLLGSAWVWTRAGIWQHRGFLMVKYLTLASVAWTFRPTPFAAAVILALTGCAWPAWVIYTAIHGSTPTRKEPARAVSSH